MNKQISMDEKHMIGAISEDRALNFPMADIKVTGYAKEREYLIPDECKEYMLKQLWPFENVPSMDATMYDIHENKMFQVKDFKVIAVKFDQHGASRYFPMLASPFYGHSGGTCLDWADIKNINKEMGVIVCARQFKKKEA